MNRRIRDQSVITKSEKMKEKLGGNAMFTNKMYEIYLTTLRFFIAFISEFELNTSNIQ